MDASGLQECFSRAVVAGCLTVSVALVPAGLALLAVRTVHWSARTVRKVGLATFLALAGLGVGAMLESTPTNESKSGTAQRLGGEAETNRLMGTGMVFGGGDGQSTWSHGDSEEGNGAPSSDGMSPPAPSSSSAHCVPVPPLGLEPAPSIRPLADADYAAGFALARVGTGETWDFAPPPGAEVSDDWTRFGAARDWFRVSWHAGDGEWGAGLPFPFGTDTLGALTVFSHGTARPDTADASAFISPLDADLGIVPESNWPLLPFNPQPSTFNVQPSQFWHHLTPSNTFVMTWRNVLLGRDPASPVSFQAELFGNGDVAFRYDLSRLAADPVTNVVVGIRADGLGRTFASLPRATTSLRWARLDGLLADDPDPDGDGIPTADEVFTYFTDPYRADTDLDGLSDYDEVNVHHTDPLDAHSVSMSLCDGFAVKLGEVDPFSFPEGSTNTVLEHLFYTGTTNAPFSYPAVSPGSAVLKVSVSGSGAGELVVGDQVVPLLAGPSGNARSAGAPANARELMVSVGQGVVKRLWLRGAADLALDTDSEDFCIGVRPTVLRPVGWCAFPFTRAEEPCIHDLSAKRVRVSLDPGPEIQGLTCDWLATTAVEVEPEPPLAARLTGRFARAETTPLAYRLGHPHHLSGRTDYVQTARYCPAAAPVPEDVWSDGPSSTEDQEEHFVERCICWVGCPGCDCPCHVPGSLLVRPQDDPNRCPDHDCPYDDCRALHLGEYAAATNSPYLLADVLKLHRPHRPQDVSAVVVDVPDGWVPCCGCPDHWTNYVAVAYKDARVSLQLDGAPFGRTVRDCVLDVRGVAPSDAVGDAVVALCRTGEVYEVRRYTVLGVGIAHPELDLDRLNALDRDFGLPVTAQTNLARAAVLKLRTDVNLPMGRIRLAFAEATARLQLWTRGPDGADLLLLDTEGSPSLELPVAQWRRLVSRATVRRETEIRLLAFGEGRARLHFGYAGTAAGGDGGPACFHDSASQAITVVPPPLLPDYDRDGSIDAADAAILRSGRPYRFWTNEDVWDGDNAFDNWIVSEVVPRGNGLDGKADGRCDMVNFFPLAVDVAAFQRAWEGSVVSVRAAFGATQPLARFREVSVPRDGVDGLHVADAPLVGGGVLHEAVLTPLLGEGTRLSGEFLAASAASGAVLAVEAAVECEDPFELVFSKDGAELFTYRPPMRFTQVEAMYRWLNVRAAGGDYGYGAKYSSRLYDPANNPDDEHAEPAHFVFVHGYNVSVQEAKYWGEGVFKRLWWSGLDARFTAVTWHGNDGQYWLLSKGFVTPNYHVNVEHAFATAGMLAEALNGLEGDKYVLAHSLGNVVVSSAIHDHGLRYAKYFLLNAAVPLEAFSEVAVTPESRHDMTPADWRTYSDPVRASHWNELFEEDDWRRSLTWRDCFAGITNAVNYYSAEEEVLANGDGTDRGLGREYAWYTQEVTKGRKKRVPVFGDPGRDEGGWSFNAGHDIVSNHYVGATLVTDSRRLTNAEALPLTNTVFRADPFFGHFEDRSVYQPTNGTDTATNATMRARLLADAIPAQSYAAGRNAVPGMTNREMSGQFKDSVRAGILFDDEDDRKWVHSFFLRVPFSVVHDLFRDFVDQLPKNGDGR